MGLTHCYKTTVFFTFIWGMLQEKVYCSRIHDVKELKDDAAAADDDVCWGSGGCWTMHNVVAVAIAQWHTGSRLNACVRVIGGHFEYTFWASDFLLCFACFIDTGLRYDTIRWCVFSAYLCKCDRYKHVQSANIGVKCVTFVSATFTQYGSNITNVWQEIFTPLTSGVLLRSCARKIMKIRQYL